MKIPKAFWLVVKQRHHASRLLSCLNKSYCIVLYYFYWFKVPEDVNDYGIDYEEPTTRSWNDVQQEVQVPETLPFYQLTTEDSRELSLRVHPLDQSEFQGVDLYLETLAFLTGKLADRPEEQHN